MPKKIVLIQEGMMIRVSKKLARLNSDLAGLRKEIDLRRKWIKEIKFLNDQKRYWLQQKSQPSKKLYLVHRKKS